MPSLALLVSDEGQSIKDSPATPPLHCDCSVSGNGEGGRVYYSSSAGQPVLCGVSRIWVLADYRRAGVASSLVDCMRASFFQATNRNIASKERLMQHPSISQISSTSLVCDLLWRIRCDCWYPEPLPAAQRVRV